MFTLKKPQKVKCFSFDLASESRFFSKRGNQRNIVKFSPFDICFVHSVVDGTWLNAVVYTYSSDKRKTRLKTCLTPPRLKLKNGPE